MSWLLLFCDCHRKTFVYLNCGDLYMYTARRIWPISRSFLFNSSSFMKEFIKFQKRTGKQTVFSREVNSTIARILFQVRCKKQSPRTIKIILQMTGNNRLYVAYSHVPFIDWAEFRNMRLKFNVKVVIPDFKITIICLVYLSSEMKLYKTR